MGKIYNLKVQLSTIMSEGSEPIFILMASKDYHPLVQELIESSGMPLEFPKDPQRATIFGIPIKVRNIPKSLMYYLTAEGKLLSIEVFE